MYRKATIRRMGPVKKRLAYLYNDQERVLRTLKRLIDSGEIDDLELEAEATRATMPKLPKPRPEFDGDLTNWGSDARVSQSARDQIEYGA